MDNDHGITGELRKWAQSDALRAGMSLRTARDQVLAIADRIDAAHEEAIKREHESAYDKGYDEGFASADDWLAQHEDAMAEHGWVRLPKDADGEYIHVGDVMDELDARCPGTPTTFTVADMFYQGNDRWHLRAYPATYDPKTCRHHHAPTVEDVLREFVERWHDTNHDDIPALFAQYAAKLRLAGDAE